MKIFSLTLTTLLSAFWGLWERPTTPSLPIAAPTTVQKVLSPSTTQEIVNLANAFKATLNASQLATAELTYSLANAKKWSNLPVTMVPRIGIRFGDLSATQLAAAKAVIRAATGTVSNEGYAELEQLWAADEYLGANGGGTTYSAGQYYLAFLGTPAMTGTWELQTGGHHLAFANTYKDGLLVGATPSFRAVEPFAPFASGANTYEPMRQERDALAAMLGSLDATQAATAKLATTFTDILLGPNKDWQFPSTRVGLQVSTLSAAQKTLVLNAIKTYVLDIDDAESATILARYTNQLDQTYIAYSGTTAITTKNDYVRIDGPSVWIEYSLQGGIVIRTENHPHSIWRDRTGDYGGTGNPTNGIKDLAQNIFSVDNYPNPVIDQTTLRFNLRQDATVKISMTDLTGRKVIAPVQRKFMAGNNVYSLDLNHLAAGTYTYSLEMEGAAPVSKKLFKQ
jgi:Protein of unknown function (DUF3500)/Secretion system C-terminal sorting domain